MRTSSDDVELGVTQQLSEMAPRPYARTAWGLLMRGHPAAQCTPADNATEVDSTNCFQNGVVRECFPALARYLYECIVYSSS